MLTPAQGLSEERTDQLTWVGLSYARPGTASSRCLASSGQANDSHMTAKPLKGHQLQGRISSLL